MADLPISSATSLDHSTIATGDLLPVVDISAAPGSKGSKITVGELTTTVNASLLGASNIFTASGGASSPALSLTGSVFTGGTSTTTKPLLLLEPSGTTSTGWSPNGTLFGVNAPSGFSGKIFDLQLNGVSFSYMDQNGLYLGMPGQSGWQARLVSNWGNLCVFGWFQTYVGGNNSILRALDGNGSTVWFNLANDNVAGVAAFRESTTAQTLRIYGTYTDSSNYERLALNTTAGAYSFKPEAAGTGTMRELHISGLPTSSAGLPSGTLWNNSGVVNVA